MTAQKMTLAGLTLAGLCVSGLAHAQSTDPKSAPAEPPAAGAATSPQQASPQPYQGQPYQGQPYQGQPYQAQPYPQQPYPAQPYPAQPYQPQPYQQPYPGQPYQPQPYQAQPYPPSQPQPYYPPQPYPGQVQPNFNQPPSTTVRHVTRRRTGLIVAGAVTLGVSWSLTVIGTVYAGVNTSCGGDSTVGLYDYSYGGCYDRLWPLFIPVLGPWIELGYLGNDPGLKGLMVFDGLVQAGGLAMILAGALTHSKVAVYAKNGLRVNPLLTNGGSGLLVSGRF